MGFFRWLVGVCFAVFLIPDTTVSCNPSQQFGIAFRKDFSTPFSFGRDSVHSPRKAALLSALLPGAGQFYNKKYWKMPLIYGAGAAGGYLIHTNYSDYSKFRRAYIYRNDNDPATVDDFPQLDGEQLKVYRDSYRRNMELSVILTTAVYLLQVLDATVDGHLYDFRVSKEMVVQAYPGLWYRPSCYGTLNMPVATLSLKLSIPY